MFHSRKLNNHINNTHERALRIVPNERALRIVPNDFESILADLLGKDNSSTIHERNIQALAIELCKVINGLSPDIMLHDVRYPSENKFKTRNVKSVRHGTDTLEHLWCIILEYTKKEQKKSALAGYVRSM